MRASNVTAAPGILLTDRPSIAAKFEDLLLKGGNLQSFISEIKGSNRTDNGALVANRITGELTDINDILFLTNNDNHFISLEYQYMANSSPRLSIELLETSEYFEARLLRSAVSNVINQVKTSGNEGAIQPPTTQFYVAFGSGDDLNYWSSFQAFMLVEAESYGEFGGAKTMKLGFVPNISLNDLEFKSLAPFISKSSLINIGILAKERVPISSKLPFNYDVGIKQGESKYFLARKEYRSKNLIYFLQVIESIIDETLQTIFNTQNILVLCPIDFKNFPLLGELIREAEGEKGGVTPAGIEKFFVDYAVSANKLQDEVLSIRTAEGEAIQTSIGPEQDPLTIVPDSQGWLNLFSSESSSLKVMRIWFKTLESLFSRFNITLALQPITTEERQFLNALSARGTARAGLKGLTNLTALLVAEKVISEEDIPQVCQTILKTFVTAYSELTALSDFTIFRETDLSILRAIDKDIRDQHGKSFFDPDKPLIVFGDMKTIASNLYGKSFRVTNQLVTPKTLVTAVDAKLYRVFNLYNSQNAKNTTLSEFIEGSNAENRVNVNIEKLIKSKNLPVFKYNTLNPNIISVTVNDNKAYFVMLNQAYTLLSNYSSLKTKVFKDPSEFAANNLLDKSLPEYQDLSEEDKLLLDMELQEAAKNSYLAQSYEEAKEAYEAAKLSTSVDASDLINKAYSKLEAAYNARQALIEFITRNTGLLTIVEDAYATDPVKFFVDQMEYLDQVTFQIEIETLPFFSISTPLFMFTPCVLLAQRPRLVGDPKLSNPLDSISGAYNILGFYHRIDSSRAYSRFKLFSMPRQQEGK